ncbi:FecR domain-containing protein [bacterium]|nr:FecR domain-containing protein [bacterium]
MPHLNDRRCADPQRYAQQLERHRAFESRRLAALRTRLSRASGLLAALLALALLLHTSAVAQQKAEIKISRIAGSVEVLHAKQTKGKWQAAKKGQAIASGWKLRTGEDGKVQLLFPLDNTVIVKNNSVLTVDKLDLGGGAETKMDAGSLLADLKTALSPGSEFEIKTPSALATVRGTKFAVLLGEPDDESAATIQGHTTVSNPSWSASDPGESAEQTRQITVVEDMNEDDPDIAAAGKQTQGATFGEKVNQGLQAAGSAGRANDRLKNAGPRDGWPSAEDGSGDSTYTMQFLVLEGSSLKGKGLSEVRDFSSIDNAPEEKERGSMSGAQSNPLYQEQGNTGENPLYEGQNRQSPGDDTAPFTPEDLFGSGEDHPLWLPAEAMGDGSVRLGDGSVFPNCISIDEPGTGGGKGSASNKASQAGQAGIGHAVFYADIKGELVMMMLSPDGPGGGGSGGSGGNPSAHIINGPCVGGGGSVPVPYPGGPSGGGGTTVIDGGGGGGGGTSVPSSSGDEAGTLGGLSTGTVTGGPGRSSGTVKFPGGGRLVMPGLRNEAVDMEFWDDQLGRWVSGGPGLGALLGGFYGEESQRVSRDILKQFFETGDRPTEQQFATFIDSMVHASEDSGLLGLKEYNPAQDQLKSNPRHRAAPGGGGAGGGEWGNPLAGNNDWNVGDWVIHNGSAWEKVDNTDDKIGAALKKEEGGRHTPFHNKYRPSARLYGYEGTVAVSNELGQQALTSGKTISAAPGEAPGAPVDSGPDAEEFLRDAEDTSEFELQEILDSADTRLQQIADKLGALAAQIDEYEKEDGSRAQYNPKEIAIDKNVPWKSGEGGGGGGGAADELTGRPVGQPAAAGLGSHVQREPKWVAGVRQSIREQEDAYMAVLEDLAGKVSDFGMSRLKGGGKAQGQMGAKAKAWMVNNYAEAVAAGGVRVAVGDLTGDGVAEQAMPAGDWDGDGKMDFVIFDSARGQSSLFRTNSMASKLAGLPGGSVAVEMGDGSVFDADALDLGDLDGDGTSELLLPAVQKIREAAARASGGGGGAGKVSVHDLSAVPDSALIGLLLPAVQKVREAAAVPDANGNLAIAEATDEILIGLLLPAVQKVRAAASSSGGGGGAGKVSFSDLSFMSDEELAALLLPAVQKIREAAARQGSGGGAGKASMSDLSSSADEEAIGLLLPAIQKVREAAATADRRVISSNDIHHNQIPIRSFGVDSDGDGLSDQFSGRIVTPVIPANKPEAGPPMAMLLLSGGGSGGGALSPEDLARQASSLEAADVMSKLGQAEAGRAVSASLAALDEGGGGGGGTVVLLLEADIDGDGREETIGSVASTVRAGKSSRDRPHTQGHVQVGGAALTIVGDIDGDGDMEEIDVDLSGGTGGGGSGGSSKEEPKVKIKDIPLKDRFNLSDGDDPGTATGGGSPNLPPGASLPSTVISGVGTTVPRPFPCKGCRMSGGGGVIGDLDGDGDPDAMVADLDGDGIGENLLLLPDGGGLVADLDGDGEPDVILSGALLRRWSEQNENALRNGVATGAGAAAGAATLDSRAGSGVLKTYFETGDIPTEEEFSNLIDSYLAPGGGSVIVEADTDGDGEWEPLSGIVIGDLDGDGELDYIVSGKDMASRRNQEQDTQDVARKMIPVTVPDISSADSITSPRDHQSGLPSGQRMRLTLDFSGDGAGVEYEVIVLGDIDGDGLDDYALDKNTQFDIELTVGKGRNTETTDEGSSAPSGGSDEYKDGDDPLTHKRAGKAKYKNIVLKRGLVNDDTELSWAEADIDGDGVSEQLLLSDTTGPFDPVKWQKALSAGKVIVRGWDPEKKELYTEQADGLIWSPRSNIAARQDFGQVQAQKKRCEISVSVGDLDQDGLEDFVLLGGSAAGKEVDKLKEEIKKLTKKEASAASMDGGEGESEGAAPSMRAEQLKKMTRKEKISAGFVDTDEDGLLDCLDEDDDGDGIAELQLGDLDGDGISETAFPVGDVDGDGLGDYAVIQHSGNVGINEQMPDTALGRKILDYGEAGDNVGLLLRTKHDTAKNSIGNIRGIIAPDDDDDGGGTDEGAGEGFFKSVGGLKMESDVLEFAEGGLRDYLGSSGKEVDTAWESVSGGGMVIEHTETTIGSDRLAAGGGSMAAGGVYVASGDVDGDGRAETAATLSLNAGLDASLSGAGEIVIEADTDGDGEWEPISGLRVAAQLSGAAGEFDVEAPASGKSGGKKLAKFKAGAELSGSVNKGSSSSGGAAGNIHGDPHTDTDKWDITADLDGDGEWEPLSGIVIEADTDGDGEWEPLSGLPIGDVDGDGQEDYALYKFDGDNTPIIRGSALGGGSGGSAGKLINPVAMDKGLRVDGSDEAARQVGKPKFEDMRSGAGAGLDQAPIQDLATLSDEQMIGLLLPAVQKIREAAARPGGGGAGGGAGFYAVPEVDDEVLIGLLLPAVQKIRAAAEEGSSGYGTSGGSGKVALQDIHMMSDEEVAALLLPAVQKIREAAARSSSEGEDDGVSKQGQGDIILPGATDEILIGLLLPAVQKIREAASKGGPLGPDYVTKKKHIGNVKFEDIRMLADLDADGEDDGFWASGGGEPGPLLRGLNSGQPKIIDNKKGLSILGSADLDQDGIEDLVVGGDIDGDGVDDLAAYWPQLQSDSWQGSQVAVKVLKLLEGGLSLSPPSGQSEEARAFIARLTDFLGRPSSRALRGHELTHTVQQGGGQQPSNFSWGQSNSGGGGADPPKPAPSTPMPLAAPTMHGRLAGGGSDGGGWGQTSGLAQFDADMIAWLYDRVGGVGQSGDAHEQHADNMALLLDEAEDLVRSGAELEGLQSETILEELALLRRQSELCGQTENLRRRVEVLKSNKQGDPDANRQGDSPSLEFTSGEPNRMNFELFFDRYEEGRASESLLEWIGELRAFSEMHRLTRGKKSKTYSKQSDQDIASRTDPFTDDAGYMKSYTDLFDALDEACKRIYRSRTGNLITMDDKAERLIPPVQKINDEVLDHLEQARLMDEEWRRYEANDQTSQMQLLYLQFMKLEQALLPLLDDELLLMGEYDSVVGDDCDDDCDGLLRILSPKGLPTESFESLHRREMEQLLRRSIGPDMEPDLYTLIPRTMDSQADLLQAAEQWEELVEILIRVADEGEPVIGDPQELEDKLTGLLPPGDNPRFEPRLGLSDSDGDGLSDVTELDLGLDPTAPNDDGFIELISPDDGDSVLYPETEGLSFEFERFDSDKVEQYILVLEAEGQIFAIRDADDSEEIRLEQLVGVDGVLAQAIDENGELHIEWHVEAQLDQSSNAGLPPGNFPGTVSSERRRLTIITPVQTEDIILDLSLESPEPINPKEIFQVRGTISEVNALGRWEIRLAYDPSLLRFVRGERQGLFNGSTVFFGDQPGGILVISGTAPAGSNGLSGEGPLFDLYFEALQPGEVAIEGAGLDLFNILSSQLEADFGEIVEFSIEAAAGVNSARPGGAAPGTPGGNGKPGRRDGK